MLNWIVWNRTDYLYKPISELLKEARKHMTHSDIHMKGINGSITALELNCNITIGNHNSPVFKEIKQLVTVQAALILISQNILSHNTVDSYSINNWNTTVEFRHTHTSEHTVHTTTIWPAFFTYHSTYIILIDWNYNLLGFAAEQVKDDAYSKIIRALQSSDSSGTHINPEDHWATLLRKHMHQFFSEARQ